MSKFKTYENFQEESIDEEVSVNKLAEYLSLIEEKTRKMSLSDQTDCVKTLVERMKTQRADLVPAFFREANIKVPDPANPPWGEKIVRMSQVGFKPLRLQVGNGGHSIYGSFYSETDRKTVLDAILSTANSVAVGSKYNFQLIQGKVRDYYTLPQLMFLAIATGVDIEEALKDKFSVEDLRGAMVALDAGII